MKRIANQWKDYECCDAGDGEKLERWQNIILRRPDPQAVWKRTEHAGWNRVHAHYHRSNRGGGSWEFKQAVPQTWTVSYKELTFKVSPTGFKHTGLFPEQAVNWDWMQSKIRKAKAAGRPVRILNMSMPARAWFNGPRKTWRCPIWKTVQSALSLTTS